MKSRFIIYIPTDTHEATAVSFARVAGVPLFLRPVLTLASKGEDSFIIVTPKNHRRQVLKNWQKITKKRGLHLKLILSSEINELKEHCQQDVYFINANYVLPSLDSFAEALSNQPPIARGEVRLLKPTTKRLSIVGVNSNVLNGAAIEVLLKRLAAGLHHHYLAGGDEGINVQNFSEIPIAENLLTEHIRKTTTATWIAKEINKRISLPLSLFFIKLRVTPNMITVANIMIGLCSGIGAAGRTYTGVLIGGLLFQLASIIDGCDGEVAKLTFKTSKFGQYADSISDNLSLAAFLTGMMIHQYRITGSFHAFVWGGALLAGALLIIAIMADYLKKHTNSASLVTYDKEFLQRLPGSTTPRAVLLLIKYFKFLFKKDVFSLMFLLFAVVGILHWWFYIAVVGVWVAVAVLGYLRLKEAN